MKTITKEIRSIALLAVLLSAPAATFGAGSDAVIKSTAIAPKVPSKARVAKIQLNEITAITAQKGWFQEEYAKINTTVQMVNISQISGVSGAEASLLDRGDLNITVRMAYPALQHKVNGLDAVVIWQGENPNHRRATTIVLADSPYKTPADLKGKVYGSSLIGCPYYAGREAFKAEGVDVDTEFQKGDLRFVNITGAAATSAFLSGRIDVYGTHPATASVAPLYLQNQVREITHAVDGGAYVTGGGRQLYFAMREWAQKNPDEVVAFLKAWDRTVRWLNSDNGAHWDEGAQIAAREIREPKAVALYNIHDISTIDWSWGVTDYNEAVAAIERFQSWAISAKDPFYTKHHLNHKEIEAFIDKRFFAGGEYFVDTSEKKSDAKAAAPQASVELPAAKTSGVTLAAAGLK